LKERFRRNRTLVKLGMSENVNNSEREENNLLKEEILEVMKKIEDEEVSEDDLDLVLAEKVLEYLTEKGLGFEIENIAVLPFVEEDFENRDIKFDDNFLAVTLDDDDEETGEKTYGVWVRR